MAGASRSTSSGAIFRFGGGLLDDHHDMSDLLNPLASEEERDVPKPQPLRPVVANPSTPGVQKPPNRPGGRDAPPAHEKRRAEFARLSREQRAELAVEAERLRNDPTHARKLVRQLSKWRRKEKRSIGESQARPVVSAGVQRRPRERRGRRVRTAAASSGDPPRSGDDDSEPLAPPLTAEQRRWLKTEINRRRRKRLERDAKRDRRLFAAEESST
jgi:hypothetical protein